MLPGPIIHKILLAYCAQPTWIMIKKMHTQCDNRRGKANTQNKLEIDINGP